MHPAGCLLIKSTSAHQILGVIKFKGLSVQARVHCPPPYAHMQTHTNYSVFLYVGACSNRDCSNAGSCVGTADGDWECLCNERQFGPNCEYAGDDPCVEPANHCHNRGVCTYTPLSGSEVRFNCTCYDGYEPIFNCEFLRVPMCSTLGEVCKNGGNCSNNVTSYTCQCPPSESA